MSEPDKKYDGNTQMIVEPPAVTNVARLRFMRWLAEQGSLEHSVAGPSSGDFAGTPSATESKPSA